MFDKVYLIKCISAVTNYNSSSCFHHNYFVKTDAGVALAPIMNIILIPGRKTTLVKKAKTGKMVEILIFMF